MVLIPDIILVMLMVWVIVFPMCINTSEYYQTKAKDVEGKELLFNFSLSPLP